MAQSQDVWTEIEADLGKESTPNPAQAMQNMEETQTKKEPKSFIPEWVTYPTGTKSLKHYEEHALNFNNSEWFGRILKGLDGLTQGQLKNFWFFDVGIGLYQGTQSKDSDPQGNKQDPEIEVENHEN